MSGRPTRLVLDECLEYSPKIPSVVTEQKEETKENYLPVKLTAAFSIEPITSLKRVLWSLKRVHGATVYLS